VLNWYKKHGRKNLPWQHNTTPYSVWISEIMLQQTQVSTVIEYYLRFMSRFPTLTVLAKAKEDEVLHLWTGLGYYARARNIHRSAKMIVDNFAENFPDNLVDLQKLPGIGKSTAGAILSFGFNQRGVILDGNVRRVLCRYHAIESLNNEDKLWEISDFYTPRKSSKEYTQAMMDLGSIVCTRTKPKCEICPLRKSCRAFLANEINRYPGKKPLKILPVKKTVFLILKDKTGKVLLEKRPSKGIWGGLWSFPEFKEENDIKNKFKGKISTLISHSPFRHTFTHFHLDILPIEIILKGKPMMVNENSGWIDLRKPHSMGLAAPVKKILYNT
jgi:A/G-specific adenine glycosylase